MPIGKEGLNQHPFSQLQNVLQRNADDVKNEFVTGNHDDIDSNIALVTSLLLGSPLPKLHHWVSR